MTALLISFWNSAVLFSMLEPAAGSVVEVLLHQPFKDAMVLFSVEHGGVLKHWIERIKTPTEHIRVPVERDWTPGFTLHAVVLDSSSDPFAAGQGTSNRAQTASLDFHVTGETGTLPLELTLDKSQIKPGGRRTQCAAPSPGPSRKSWA